MMAPEFFDQNLESQGYSYSVDHYALGILFYELLVGHVRDNKYKDISPHSDMRALNWSIKFWEDFLNMTYIWKLIKKIQEI